MLPRPHASWIAGLIAGGALVALADRLWLLEEEPDLAHYRRVRDFVEDAFVGETGRERMLDDALRGLVGGLDAYSRYYDRAEARALERETVGRYTGVGAVFLQPLDQARILFTLPGSPARRAGLEVGDRIVRVGDRAVEALGEDGLRALLSGEGPIELSLEVVGLDGARRKVTLARERLVDPTVRHERIVDARRGVGYLAVTSFSHETPLEFERAFEDLRALGMRALVVDLRANPGGVLDAAVRIARRFVPSGVICATEGRGEPAVHRADPAEARYLGFPLVVLVDEGSASASEVLAGALQDHRRAVVVGSATYGKGMVQTLRRFADRETVVKLTTSRYTTPAGRVLERDPEHGAGGIEPDLAVPLAAEERDAVHGHLSRYSPPRDSLERIAAWQVSEGRALPEPPPEDAQLAAAVALFAGERGGEAAAR
jgi:carboxyl-terminal processing protease